MLRIKKGNPYYVLPSQRYDLTTLPPSEIMQKDFTFFVKFNMFDVIENQTTPSSIMMRPGMHYGLTYNQNTGNISWEYWYEFENEDKFEFVTLKTEPYSLTDEWIVIIQHNLDEKTFKMSLISKDNTSIEIEKTYSGRLCNYAETPYNFGCGNYFEQVEESHYFWGDYNLHYSGLIKNCKVNEDDILKFVSDNTNSKFKLNNYIDDLVFYFNFNEQNKYKVWDLSGHCNFLMKNMDIGK